MRRYTLRVSIMTGVLLAAAAGAARADVCVTIDEPHDTFSPQDRAAALLLVATQFELAGERVVPEGCPAAYTVSHVSLGNTIVVTMSGPNGHRQGTARGLDDLPALYSQMVRSIVTGRPMTGFNVVDRTNVTVAQSSQRRIQSDSFAYARLGYGSLVGDRSYGGPAMGFGYRTELDAFAIDVSFLNFQVNDFQGEASGSYYESVGYSYGGSLLKLEGLYFLKPAANASAYVGGGVSWGNTGFSNGNTYWHGSGLQGEMTVGYELPRASTLRWFVQADAALPFYRTTSETHTFSRTAPVGVVITERRYTPSLAVSAGVGWQRHRR